MELTDIARPGLMVTQTWPDARKCEGETLRAVEAVLRHGYFKAIQTSDIPFPAERKALAGLVARHGVASTYSLTDLLLDQRLNLTGSDESNRRRGWSTVAAALENAVDAGADTVSLAIGPGPAEGTQKSSALHHLADSLHRLSQAARAFPGLQLVIEPFDQDPRQRNPLDTTADSVALCRTLAGRDAPLHLCLDTAHMTLNREPIGPALRSAIPFVLELQFCNCITDPHDERYGERGIPFGAPGFLDVHAMGDILREALDAGFLDSVRKPLLFCDVHKSPAEDPRHVMDVCEAMFHGAWELAHR
jgi:sugar phosphate isomerase/epimerase